MKQTTLLPASAAALLGGGAALTLLLGAPQAPAIPRAGGPAASAQLVQMQATSVPPLEITAFSGTYGTSSADTVGQTGTADFSDPDGVLTYVRLDGAKTLETDNQSAKVYARSGVSGMTLFLGGSEFLHIAPRVGSIGSIDTYAECVPPPVGPYALAYARTDSDQINVLGHQVPLGNSTLTVSGTELHHPSTVRDGTLSISYTQTQVPAAQDRSSTAHAGVEISVGGVINGTDGSVLYSGPIVSLQLGEVRADCEAASPTPTRSPTPSPSLNSVTPTPSPTKDGPTPPPSPSPSPTWTPRPSPSPSTSSSESASPSPTTSPTPSASASAPASERTELPSASPSGGLPETGRAAGLPVLLGGSALLAAVLGGVALFAFRRWGRRH